MSLHVYERRFSGNLVVQTMTLTGEVITENRFSDKQYDYGVFWYSEIRILTSEWAPTAVSYTFGLQRP